MSRDQQMSPETFNALQRKLIDAFGYSGSGNTIVADRQLQIDAARGLIELETYRVKYLTTAGHGYPSQGYNKLNLK